MDVIDWLCAGDPAIAWQVLRDLVGAGDAEVARVRTRVAREGIGAAVPAAPGGRRGRHTDGVPTWLSTLATADLLRAAGPDPRDPAVEAAIDRLAAGFRWHEAHGARTFFGGEVE